MAQLYFKYGAMGSSKTANALMARFNYEERGQKTLLVKPRMDQRDGDHMVHSRIGLEYPCVYFDEMRALSEDALKENACIIVDEAQFLSKEEVDYLVHVVDDLGVPVICYGLRADFKGELFPGSYELLVMADKLEEVKTICWCGKKAMFNARFDENGKVLKEGAQVVLGANEKYTALCRRLGLSLNWFELLVLYRRLPAAFRLFLRFSFGLGRRIRFCCFPCRICSRFQNRLSRFLARQHGIVLLRFGLGKDGQNLDDIRLRHIG